MLRISRLCRLALGGLWLIIGCGPSAAPKPTPVSPSNYLVDEAAVRHALPTQLPAPPQAPPTALSGRLLIATTRTSLRPRSDLPVDYRLAWLDATGLHPVPVPDEESGVSDAAIGPDGSIAAIVGGHAVYLLSPGASAAREPVPRVSGLVPTPTDGYLDVTWLGDRLLLRETAPTGLVAVRPDGTGRQIFGPLGRDAAPAPDGTRVALSHSEGDAPFSIYVLDPAAEKLAKVSPDPLPEATPAWSPDGASIAYVAQTTKTPPDWQVRVAPAGGGLPRALTSSQGSVRPTGPRWAPDGAQLAMTLVDNIAHTRQIVVVPATGGEPTGLGDGQANDRVLAWVP